MRSFTLRSRLDSSIDASTSFRNCEKDPHSVDHDWDDETGPLHSANFVLRLVHDSYLKLIGWQDTKEAVQRLRTLGMPETGIEARQAIEIPGEIRNVFPQLRRLADLNVGFSTMSIS